ncbi:MAG: DUF4124 domain-containing protein [Gammaproteobacteria bacterium]
MNCFRALATTTLLAVTLASTGVVAEVFKCTNAKGVITYQDIPCASGHTEERIDLSATTSTAEQSESVKAALEALRKQDEALAERLQRDSESRRELAARTPAPTYTNPSPSDDSYSRDSSTVWVPYEQPIGWRAGIYYPPQYHHPHQYPVAQNGYRNNVYHDFRDSPYYNSVAGYPLPNAPVQPRHQSSFGVGVGATGQHHGQTVPVMGTVIDE